MNIVLWIVQVLVALLFAWAGGVKLVLPLDQLEGPFPLPGPFIRFIGVCEVAGALGLILPSLLRIKPMLTPLAAAGLVVIMIGATVISSQAGPPVLSLIPAALGVLCAFVAWGRWKRVPIAAR